MTDVKGEAMWHKGIARAAMLVVLIAAVGLSIALAGASLRSGSHVSASWASGAEPGPDASRVDDSGELSATTA
jgi:hypothetical protein